MYIIDLYRRLYDSQRYQLVHKFRFRLRTNKVTAFSSRFMKKYVYYAPINQLLHSKFFSHLSSIQLQGRTQGPEAPNGCMLFYVGLLKIIYT